ncbi:MAG TPA: hypothetical protein VJ141_02585 [Candidatus Limnocylindrales bacterium]|nr:hypothetical protein [Candidatus Limnocylindrales bacterium]HLE78773.1 hypothetical protein [Candidatus Limnocylindrales bacterium]
MRNVLTVLMVVVGFALQGISYFVLADPWVTTGIPSGEPRLIAAPTLFIAGVVLVFLAAVLYELLPERRGR